MFSHRFFSCFFSGFFFTGFFFLGFFFCVGAALIFALPLPAAAEGADCKIAEGAMTAASQIRNLPVLKPVPCSKKNREEVEQYLREHIAAELPPAKLNADAQIYKLLGIIPESYDYMNGMIELYRDQVAGYYDPKKRAYVMANWIPQAIQMSIAVHELTHALQDQHYNLGHFLEETKESADRGLALAGLIEGDASAVMLDFTRRESGAGPLAKEPSVLPFLAQNLTGAMLSESLRKAPPALQNLLLFPYLSGLNFAHALLRQGGYGAIDRAFRSPPTTAEEILHPEKYLQPVVGESVKEETPSLPPPFTKGTLVEQDTLGEFFIATFLGTTLQPAKAGAAAAGWRGDRLALYSAAEGVVLLWNTSWDTEKDSEEFFTAVKEGFTSRFGAPKERAAEGERALQFQQSETGTEATLTIKGQKVALQIVRVEKSSA
jgi:hypothetical protein